jgi:hypothetical protein
VAPATLRTPHLSVVASVASVAVAGPSDARAVESSVPVQPPVSSLDIDLLERRLEARAPAVLPIAAARCDGAGATALGSTVNVSISGLLVAMDDAAPGDSVDMLVGESYSVVLRGKVIAQHESDHGHLWHVLVVEADPSWQMTIEGLVQSERSTGTDLRPT